VLDDVRAAIFHWAPRPVFTGLRMLVREAVFELAFALVLNRVGEPEAWEPARVPATAFL